MSNSGWNIIAASVVGTSHVEKGAECQDAFVCETFDAPGGESLVIVASDGAGSAKYGKTGATKTCRSVADLFRGALTGKMPSSFLCDKEIINSLWLMQLQKEFVIEAAKETGTLSDYACTLLAAAITPRQTVFWQIGDGAIVYSEAGEYRTFIAPQQGEYANSTFFVTDAHAVDNLQIGVFEKPIDEIAVFTDGLQRIALDSKTAAPHAPFFRPMFAPLLKNQVSPALNDRLVEFLKSPKINERTDDDKTLILAARKKLEPSAIAGGHKS